MANPTPNNPNSPKKPVPPVAKGVAPGKVNGPPVAKPAPKPAAPAKPAAAAKPVTTAKPAAKTATKAPEPRQRTWTGADGGHRKFGQVVVDPGYIEEADLWSLLEEARNAALPAGRIVLDRA